MEKQMMADQGAYDSSDEEFAPLESIVPTHLQKKENLQGYVKKTTIPSADATMLEKQMSALEEGDDSGNESSSLQPDAAISFQIGGHTTKPKASTMKDVRSSEKPNPPEAVVVDFQAALLANNLQNVEQPLSVSGDSTAVVGNI